MPVIIETLATWDKTENSMPLPVAHSLLGATVCVVADRDAVVPPGRLFAAMVLANAADLDYLAGILVGEPHRFHRMASHSVTVAVVVGLAAALLVNRGWLPAWPVRRGWPSGAAGTALVVSLLALSHVLLDSLNADYSDPVGVQAFWPFSQRWMMAFPLFYNVEKLAGAATPLAFLSSLLIWHNVKAALLEVALLGPLLFGAVWWRRRGDSAAR
ncbi:MAG: hypothetical protein GKS06_14390 [Acidobacteria bacterium]|nr:hypothetical protein [Acidobacteriota bacterium]